MQLNSPGIVMNDDCVIQNDQVDFAVIFFDWKF